MAKEGAEEDGQCLALDDPGLQDRDRDHHPLRREELLQYPMQRTYAPSSPVPTTATRIFAVRRDQGVQRCHGVRGARCKWAHKRVWEGGLRYDDRGDPAGPQCREADSIGGRPGP